MGPKNRLYLKISATLLILLAILGGSYIWISRYVAEDYVAEINQQLFGGIAASTVQEVQPFVNGRVDTTQIQEIMHAMMVINPSVEVYLLDPAGKIITYVAPYKKVNLDSVDLAPIRAFVVAGAERPFLKGDDPRHPGERNIFSAAPVRRADGTIEGYVYIILAGEEQAAVIAHLQETYMFRLGLQLFLLSLLAALIIGLLALWYLTGNLRRITETVVRFRDGDYQARIPAADRGDFAQLAQTFNGMADRIVANIEELRSVERLRRELIANISHDLRTPLAIMQGFVETLLMKNETLSPAGRARHLRTVLDSAERLSTLIAQLFDYSKLEAKQIVPRKEAFFLGELAQDVVHKYRVLATEKNLLIELDLPEQPLPLIFADVSLVERVLQNLMDNALKFTPPGGRVVLRLREQPGHVEVRIADTGPGIPETEQAHIFERYKKAGRNVRESDTGAGLGLAIVKKILELHDQTIRVQSRRHEGTAFIFQLPAYEA